MDLARLDAYADQFRALLPHGLIWRPSRDSNLYRLLQAFASEMERIESRAKSLRRELDPHFTNEMLEDWERITGMPPECVPPPESLIDRRNLVLAQLGKRGGQSRQFYIDLAASLGYTVEIREFHPFVAGPAYGDDRSKAGDALYNEGPGWHHCWVVEVQDTYTIRTFKAGQSVAGDPLATWGNWELECLLVLSKPAHTLVFMNYPGLTPVGGFQATSVPQQYEDPP
jgi:uncharacterized protein YmfQ (DUF2313 family)